MRKAIFLLCSIWLTTMVSANDTYFFRTGGGLQPTSESDNTIELKEELISITLHDQYYEVTVDFSFYNPQSETTISVGFPFFEIGIAGTGRIFDFKCWTNGIETDYSNQPIDKEWSEKSGKPEPKNAYVRNIMFKAKSYTITRISYKSDYGRSATSDSIASYLYGTGSSWMNSIGKIVIQIRNNMTYQMPSDIVMGTKHIGQYFNKISDDTFEADFTNIEPDYGDYFSISLRDIINDIGPRRFPAYFKWDKEIITENDMFWLARSQLRIVRNTIYALHGYVFKSEDLKDLFNSEWTQFWNPPYKPNPDFREDELSEIEKENIRILFAKENE